MYRDPGDATGQNALIARADLKGPAGQTWFRYSHGARTQGTGEIEYFEGTVSNPNTDERAGDTYLMSTVDLNVNSKPLIKPAS